LINGIKSILNAASNINLFNKYLMQTFAKMVAVEKFNCQSLLLNALYALLGSKFAG
jgi:hypothetical protein